MAPPRDEPLAVCCHTDNVDLLRRRFSEPVGPAGSETPNLLASITIVGSNLLPKFARRWVPPQGRFWFCEQSDRAWCEPLGLGRWEDVPFMVGFHGRVCLGPLTHIEARVATDPALVIDGDDIVPVYPVQLVIN